MGTVYRATDIRLARPVAIKILHASLGNDLGVRRFQSEITIAAKLRHPNIVPVHDSGVAEGRLFYVMDYLGGETLRERLRREKQLSVEDAISIATDVAAGLSYAHAQGVVHRDVKPENIILADGRALVLDFGLARALGDGEADRLTESGISVGTPHYISPEQAAAERNVGPAADQYALACVVYEMLAGEPPFTGPTAAAVAMRHVAGQVVPLGERRRSVPASVEAAVAKGLEKVPADRFRSVSEFAEALRAGGSEEPTAMTRGSRATVPTVSKRSRLWVVGAAVVLTALGAVIARPSLTRSATCALTSACLDSTRYVVVPSGNDGVDRALSGAIDRWKDLSTPTLAEVRSRRSPGGANPREAAVNLGRSFDAGRVVVTDVAFDAGEVRVDAELIDVATGQSIHHSMARIATKNLQDSVASALLFELLFGVAEGHRFAKVTAGTSSKPAVDAYIRGRAALRTWDLLSADSAFALALHSDAQFPQASLWLAQTRAWSRDDDPTVAPLVASALTRRESLNSSDMLRARGLDALANRQFAEACNAYQTLVRADSEDMTGWIGLSECNRRDPAVVPDAGSPSGYAFRGSQRLAAAAIQHAFLGLAAFDSCCLKHAFDLVRRPLFIYSNRARFGTTDGTTRYTALPEIHADTLAQFPRPIGHLITRYPTTYFAALIEQRRKFLDIAKQFSVAHPRNSYLLGQLAEAMELVNDPDAIDTLERAASLSRDDDERLDFASRAAFLRLKLAIPNRPAEIAAIHTFADSVVKHTPARATDPKNRLAALAVLAGDANKVADLASRAAPSIDPRQPPRLAMLSARFLAYAASNGPVDSMAALDRQLLIGIENAVPADRRSATKSLLFARPVRVAFPIYRSAQLSSLATNDPLLTAEAALARGDLAIARAAIRKLDSLQRDFPISDMSYDAVYPQVWTHLASGDTSGAVKLATRALAALPFVPSQALADPINAGCLTQLILLTAKLEKATGDNKLADVWSKAAQSLAPSR